MFCLKSCCNRSMAFYRIKEAAEKVGVPAHVLRFWETQFPQLKPKKTGRGQRLFDDDNVRSFLKVKHLLYVEGFSIPGAKKHLKEENSAGTAKKAILGVQKLLLQDMKRELQSIIQFTQNI